MAVTLQPNKYSTDKTTITATLKLIKWHKAFINSNYELAHIPGDPWKGTMTKQQAAQHLSESLMRSINERAGVTFHCRYEDYQFKRDQHRVSDCIHKRIIVRQFETRQIKDRFSHILTTNC